jgi:PAS domain S-box-containing protein
MMSFVRKMIDKDNVTQGLSAEQREIDYQKKLSIILESFTDAFFEVDNQWMVTYWNKEAERMLLVSRDSIIGKNLWDVFEEAVYLKFYTEYHRALGENVSVRFEEYFAPRKIWVEVAAFPSGNGLSVYFKDITANKHALALLEAERKKYIDLFNQSPLPQWVYDSETLQFLDVNEAAIKHYQYSRQEFLNMSLKDIRLADDVAELEEIILSNVKKYEFNESNVRHKKKNGELISVVVKGNTVFFEGRTARLVIVIDRTTEIQAQKDLEASVQRFDIVSKATSDAIWDCDMQSGETWWNRGIAGIFGHRDPSYSHDWWEQHIHPDDLEKVVKKMDLAVATQKSRVTLEYRFRCYDGAYKVVLDRAFLIFNAGGEVVRMIGSMQDITVRVEDMKAIKAQNDRLMEISWLQSHKIRSPLAKILGLVGLMKVSKDDMEAINELVPVLSESAEELDGVLKRIVNKNY